MKIQAIIEKVESDSYSIFTEDSVCDCSPGGFGSSVDDAKKDFFECLSEMKEISLEEGKVWPDSIEVEFSYDLPSFFNCFDWINVSRFAKEAHINESKMRAYKKGICNASEKTMAKIANTLKRLGAELQAATI